MGSVHFPFVNHWDAAHTCIKHLFSNRRILVPDRNSEAQSKGRIQASRHTNFQWAVLFLQHDDRLPWFYMTWQSVSMVIKQPAEQVSHGQYFHNMDTEIRRRRKSLNPTWGEVIRGFCQNTTLHGMNRVVEASPFFCRK